ncbi:MAG: hypothetical protein ACRDKL_03495 [Solirubrobacteraceae bacterium]
MIRTPNCSRIRLVLTLGAATAATVPALLLSPTAGAMSQLPPLRVAVSTANATASGNLPFVQGEVYAVTYTFTDTANAKLTAVAFSDHLPTGVTVATGTTASALNCGHFKPANEAGSSTITADGFTVYGNSPNRCAMEFFVTAGTLEGPSSDTAVMAHWTDDGTPEPNSDVMLPTWRVSVTSPPTMAISFPANGASFAFNQLVHAQLTATSGAGDAITSAGLYAVDEVGDEVSGGGLVPTDIPGRHTLTVWAQTADGFIGAGPSISYTVRSPAPLDLQSDGRGHLTFKIRYLQTGTVTATERYDGIVVGTNKRWVHVGFEMPMWVHPNAAGQRILARHPRGVTVSLTLRYRQWNIHSFTSTPAVTFHKVHLR